MQDLPSNPVTLRDIKKILKQSPNSTILYFIFQKEHYDEVEENAKQLAQEFDKELNVTPLFVQGAQGLSSLSQYQIDGQSVIIAIPSAPPAPDDNDDAYAIAHSLNKRTKDDKCLIDTLKQCARKPLVILMAENIASVYRQPKDIRTAFGISALALSSVVSIDEANGWNVILDKSHKRNDRAATVTGDILKLNLQ